METLIKNGRVVGPSGILNASLAIDKGKIVAAGGDACLPSADRAKAITVGAVNWKGKKASEEGEREPTEPTK